MEPGLAAGTLLDGKYRILRLIGRGGMGAVYEGENERIARRVAIKVLHSSAATDRRLVDRFEREAQAANRIGSHHVTDVLDFGELASGDRFMVMEYLQGQSLAERLGQEGTLPPAKVIAIAVQLLEGLAMTHEAGIVHRDLKPANIFLAASPSGDFVKILDFGICKFRAAGDLQWTTSGSTVLGTPGYLSPEQLTSDDVGSDADLYAVGVVIYRCIAGRLPYDASTKAELLLHIRDGLRIPISEVVADLDKELASLVMRGVAPRRADRFANAREYKDALLAWAKGAEDREQLLADFLDRPKTASFVPALVTQPPRFRAGVTTTLSPVPVPVPIPVPVPVPVPAPVISVLGEDGASTVPVDTKPPPAELPPRADEGGNLRADVNASAPAPAPAPSLAAPPSKVKAIAVGAVVGVASAVALYEAFR